MHSTLYKPFLLLLGLALILPSMFGQIVNRSGEDSTIFVSHTVFLAKESFSSGEQNWCIGKADLNEDGLEDLVVGSKLDGKAHIHYANGDGSFRNGPDIPTRQHTRALNLFDADGDGDTDMATVTMKGYLSFAKNLGGGKFEHTGSVLIGGLLQDVESIDIDRDGDLDLLVAATTLNEVIWFRNEDNFQFTKATSWRTGRDPRALEIGDLNMDGQLDLVVGCDNGKIYTYLGESGGFRTWGNYSSGAANWAVAIGDVNGDGRNDIATASYLDKWLTIHLNQGAEGFPISQQILSGDHNFDIAACDFDLDGDIDLATCSTLDMAIGFHLNDGNGFFSARNTLSSGDWNAGIVVSDVDQDGDPDLAIASINDHQVHIHRNISIYPEETLRKTIRLTGFVIHEETGEKISNVPVSLKRASDQEIIQTELSDESGAYEFLSVPAGSYLLIGRAPGFPVEEIAFEMPEEDAEQDIFLNKAPSTFVYGLVTDKISRELLTNATIQIKDDAGTVLFTLLTDERGRYKTAIDPISIAVAATLEGHQGDTVAAEVLPNQPNGTRVDLSLTPIPTDACLAGVVYDEETNEPIPAAIIAIRDVDGNPVKKIRANESGAYRVCLPFGQYQFSTTAKGYFFKVDDVTVTEPEPESSLTFDIYLQPLKKGAHIVLEHIYFDVDKSTLRPESVQELERLVDILSDNPSLVVSIEGHTDSDATDSYNLRLSDRRSGSVVEYLINTGIQESRLLYQGFGESQPVAPNDSPENKQLNRRTECRVVEF